MDGVDIESGEQLARCGPRAVVVRGRVEVVDSTADVCRLPAWKRRRL